MGASISAPQQPSSGKGNVTTPVTSGQPQFGAPNQYPNTIQPNRGGWDNATIGSQSSGKGGKGQSSWQPFNQQWTPPNTTDIYKQ